MSKRLMMRGQNPMGSNLSSVSIETGGTQTPLANFNDPYPLEKLIGTTPHNQRNI